MSSSMASVTETPSWLRFRLKRQLRSLSSIFLALLFPFFLIVVITALEFDRCPSFINLGFNCTSVRASFGLVSSPLKNGLR